MLGVAISTLFILSLIDSIAIDIVYLIIHIVLLVSFTLSALMQPGYVTKDKDNDFQELLDNIDAMYLGPECEVIRTPRSRHGNLGNRGIDRYDHHGPYVNNCVGYRNHLPFVIFLVSIGILLAFQIVITGYSIKFIKSKQHSWDFLRFKHSDSIYYIVDCLVLSIGALFLLPVGILTFTHISNFWIGKTTHERFAEKKGEDPSLLTTSKNNSLLKSSVKTLLHSDLLVHDDTEIQSYNYVPNQHLSDSYVGLHKRRGRCKKFCKMIHYKMPSQDVAKAHALRQTKRLNIV